jgi:hypothetical protein
MGLIFHNETQLSRQHKHGLFGSFPYVCPEPVLVKYSFLHFYLNGSIRPFLLTICWLVATRWAGCEHTSRRNCQRRRRW